METKKMCVGANLPCQKANNDCKKPARYNEVRGSPWLPRKAHTIAYKYRCLRLAREDNEVDDRDDDLAAGRASARLLFFSILRLSSARSPVYTPRGLTRGPILW